MTIDIERSIICNATILDGIARNKLGGATTGATSTPLKSVIHLAAGATNNQKLTAGAILDDYDTLAVSASISQFIADGVGESVLTCVSLGNDFDYAIVAPGGAVTVGTVTDGTLELSGYSTGFYRVAIIDPNSEASGLAIVEGVEA